MNAFETLLQNENEWLIGLCARLSADDAQDIAQETLIEAWRHQHKLVDPAGIRPWLAAIARNVCLRWKSKAAREHARISEAATELENADNFEVMLERNELTDLLSEALSLLPEDTRETLVAKFMDGLSTAEIARRMGISEGHVAVRVHRGKSALERIVREDLRPDFEDLNLLENTGQWHETSMYCPNCGQHKLQGKLNAVIGSLILRCPHCFQQEGRLYNNTEALPQVLRGVKGFKPAHTRIANWARSFYVPALKHGSTQCLICGRTVTPRLRSINGDHLIDASCPHCGCINYTSLKGTSLGLPEGLRFWRENPRLRLAAYQRIEEMEGQPAVLMAHESVLNQQRYEVVFGLASYEVLRVEES